MRLGDLAVGLEHLDRPDLAPAHLDAVMRLALAPAGPLQVVVADPRPVPEPSRRGQRRVRHRLAAGAADNRQEQPHEDQSRDRFPAHRGGHPVIIVGFPSRGTSPPPLGHAARRPGAHRRGAGPGTRGRRPTPGASRRQGGGAEGDVHGQRLGQAVGDLGRRVPRGVRVVVEVERPGQRVELPAERPPRETLGQLRGRR